MPFYDYRTIRKAVALYDETGCAKAAAQAVGASPQVVMRWVRCVQLYGDSFYTDYPQRIDRK